MTNYNRQTRDISYGLINSLKQSFNNPNISDSFCYVSMQKVGEAISSYEAEYDVIKECNVYVQALYMVLYSDLYLSLHSKEKKEKINYIEKSILDRLKKVEDYRELPELFEDDINLWVMAFNSMMNFKKMSVYDKILINKSESTHVYEKLCEINTFHSQDKENYDIEVTPEFIVNKINSQLKNNSIEKLVMDAGVFIRNLINISDESGYNTLYQLIENDIKLINYKIKTINFENDESEDNKDKFINMKERYNKYKINGLQSVIEKLRVCDICDLLESYMEYINYNEKEKEEVDKLTIDKELENISYQLKNRS